MQHLGDCRYRFGDWTQARIAAANPIAADTHNAGTNVSGTTTSATEAAVITWSAGSFSIAPDFVKKIRIKGRPVFNGLFGVVSSLAAATATLTKIEVVIVEYDNTNTLVKNLCWKESEAVDIAANGASGDVEVKESISLVFDPVDAVMDNVNNNLGVQVAVWGKASAGTTTCKIYINPGSEDCTLEIPFV